VSIDNDSEAKPFEEAHSKLTQGLKSCHSVVENYRSLLQRRRSGGEATGEPERPFDAGEERIIKFER